MYPSIRGKAKANINIRLNKRTHTAIFGCARLMRSMRQIGPPIYRFRFETNFFSAFITF